jgi:hypothetical protein
MVAPTIVLVVMMTLPEANVELVGATPIYSVRRRRRQPLRNGGRLCTRKRSSFDSHQPEAQARDTKPGLSSLALRVNVFLCKATWDLVLLPVHKFRAVDEVHELAAGRKL